MLKKSGIVHIGLLFISILGIAIAATVVKDPFFRPTIEDEESIVKYDEIDGFCRILGDDSNLLYKNDDSSSTTYSEKVIFLDEASKAQMAYSPANEVFGLGSFEGEFIRVKYHSNLSDNELFLTYITEGAFRRCTTNKMVKKAFDKNGNEIAIPTFNLKKDTKGIPSDLAKVYALLITVVLKKQTANINIDDEKQVEHFWNQYANYTLEEATKSNGKNYERVDIAGTTYYHRLTENTWNGEYHQDAYYTPMANNKLEVVSYKDYLKYLQEINADCDEKIKNYYTDKQSNYIILSYATGFSWCNIELIDCIEKDQQIILYGDETVAGFMAGGSGYLIVIPTNMPVGTDVQFRECYSTSEISNLQNYGNSRIGMLEVDKPIIYLYPEEETNVSVKLLKKENITCSYPKYEDGWNVLAHPNGMLEDLTTNRQLYSLYYESKNAIDFPIRNEGFLVKGCDVINFLEEKLAILGLTEREAEEFIIYWLPKLESNNYNYIRFATLEEINENMPLSIHPKPDTTIRVLMIVKGLDHPIDVQEQELITPDRTGFVAVEWGGMELK